MKFKKVKKWIALSMTIVLLVPAYVFNYGEENSRAKEKKDSINKASVVRELKNERTENSSTFLLSDGSKKLVFSPEKTRFKEEGKLIDYDTSLSTLQEEDVELLEDKTEKKKEQYSVVNKNGDCKQFFPEKFTENGIVLAKDNYLVEMQPILNEEEEYILDVKKSVAKYKDKEGNIEYRYESEENGIKENIVLNSKPNNARFKFRMNLKNVYLKQLKDDKNIYVLDKNNDKMVAYIPVPNIADGNGVVNSEDVSYSLTTENGMTYLSVSVENNYFENDKLKYPVTIDPVMAWFDTSYLNAVELRSIATPAGSKFLNLSEVWIFNHVNNTNYYSGQSRVFIDTSLISTSQAFIGDGDDIMDKYIESAELFVYENQPPNQYYSQGTVQVQRVLDSWNPSTVTWGTQPSIANNNIDSFQVESEEGTFHSLDITDWAQDIANGTYANKGLALTCPQEGMCAQIYGTPMHYVFENGGVENRHLEIDIVYRDIEDYDASVEMEAECHSDSIGITIKDNNELAEGVSILGYKVFGRKNNEGKFSVVSKGGNINNITSVNPGDVNDIDLRVAIFYSDGTVRLSNILSFKKKEEETTNEETTIEESATEEATEEETTEEETTAEETTEEETTEEESTEEPEPEPTFEPTIKDTDGDSLEDGYEIWDLNTFWNTETNNSTPDNPEYDLDTDDDGFPDSYEVYTLGTDPTVPNRYDANNDEIDSDNDDSSDYEEYVANTDPWAKDSDFDNVMDPDDATPRKTNNHTYQTVASNTAIHKGKYDRQYSVTENGVTKTYIENIYKDIQKMEYYNYGNPNLNKRIKYFFDAYGNTTAMVEEYDSEYYDINGLNDSQTICITYKYDDKGNIVFVCDQNNRYTMNYTNDYDIDLVKVGNQNLISYDEEVLVDNNENYESLSIGDIVKRTQNIAEYSNGQTIKVITATKKVTGEDNSEVAKEMVYYYNNSENASYKVDYNSDDKIINLADYTGAQTVSNQYTYTESGVRVVRSDGFTRETQKEENKTENKLITRSIYNFKDVQGENTQYSSVESSELEENDESDEISSTMQLFNSDKVTSKYSKIDHSNEISIYSELYEKNVLKTKSTVQSNTKTDYEINIKNNTKNYEYDYDLAGNIIGIKYNDELIYGYNYDAHGRLTVEKDYKNHTSIEYKYDETCNIHSVKRGEINSSGQIIHRNSTVNYAYENSNWPDQVTSIGNNEIVYDNAGNPTSYINGETFVWSRGRLLSEIRFTNNQMMQFKYGENGFRQKKETNERISEYEWDDEKLIREQVTYKATNKKYDIWYLYDSEDGIAGYEYSYVGDDGNKERVRVYYEKNLQGDVIGLLDSRGIEIATYSYDAWGNTISTVCYEGNSEAYNLNSIKYRGYYEDKETGYYYLQSRYYDPSICRFLNADEVNNIGTPGMIYGNNLYSYCEGNPVKYTDVNGKSLKSLWSKIKKRIKKLIRGGNKALRAAGLDTAKYGAFILQMKKDKKGIYHASFNGWQQYFGYNDFYDSMFEIVTYMRAKQFFFSHGPHRYVLWLWKGDYINLGAGAELGIYYGGPNHWKVEKKNSMPMKLLLKYKNKQIISYKKRTWWITGFNPKYQCINIKKLKVTFTVCFPPVIYKKFKYENAKKGWKYNNKNNTGVFSF